MSYELLPLDDIEDVVARYTFLIERGQDAALDRVNVWLDKMKPMDEEADDNREEAPPPHVAKAMSQIAIYAATYGTADMYLRDPVVAKPITIVREWLKQWGYTFEDMP